MINKIKNRALCIMNCALPLDIYVKKEFYGLKEIHIEHAPEDEPLISWLMNKAQKEECV